MKILPINNNQQLFKGYSKYIYLGNNDRKSLLFDYHRLYFDDEKSLSEVIHNSKIPIPEPSVQKTLGSFHAKEQGTVYFADPYEVVGEDIKSLHDYIVYDCEPSYPDVNKEVSRNYFGTEHKNYGEEFQDIHDYYKRAEIADWKTLNEIKNDPEMPFDKKREKVGYYEHRIDVSKYQEYQAVKCKEIYCEGDSLRNEKEWLEYKNETLEKDINDIKARVENNKTEIANEEKLNIERRRYIETLNERVKKYEDLKAYTDACIDTAADEKQQLEELLSKRNQEYNQLVTLLAESEIKIKKLIKENKEAPDIIKGLRDNITKNSDMIEKIKGKLIPLFDKLKEYYITQGIKVIKKI